MQEDTTMELILEDEEVQAVKDMFVMLQEIYGAHCSAGQMSMALEHLMACRLLLALAERDQRHGTSA